MAFKGEIQLGILNTLVSMSGVAKYDIYRVQGSGNLEPNNFGVKSGDFVRWTGTKWEPSTANYALTSDVAAEIYDSTGRFVHLKTGTGGNYWPSAEELSRFHKDAILQLTINDELYLVLITSDAKLDDDNETYFSYQVTDLLSAVSILEARIYALEQANS